MQCVYDLEQIKAKLLEIKPLLPDVIMEDFTKWLEDEFNVRTVEDIERRLCEACDYVDAEDLCFRCDEKCTNIDCDNRE